MCITVFIRKDSLPCFATQRAFRRLGMNFTVHCVDDDPVLEQRLKSEGFDAYPVVIADDLRWCGFRSDMINRLRLHHRPVYD